jgi:hypothetical protein
MAEFLSALACLAGSAAKRPHAAKWGEHYTYTVGTIMNTELRERLLPELSRPDLVWKQSPNHESHKGAALRWVPIANLTDARIELGLSSDAFWLRATSQSTTVFSSNKPCVFLLPILEVDLRDVRRSLEHGLQENGLSGNFVRLFPFECVVITGLESHSEHWAGLALKWAEQLAVSSRIQSALDALIAKGPTQRLRHAAQKLRARQRGSAAGENEPA